MSDTLKPCPFCGGEGWLHRVPGGAIWPCWKHTESCPVHYNGRHYLTDAEAIAAGNTRTPPTQVGDDVVERQKLAREILNRHLEYMDGLSRGQVSTKTSTALAAIEEALAITATRSGYDERLLKQVYLAGHSEGWTGNQMRRDVQHVDADKGWQLFVKNGALAALSAHQEDKEDGRQSKGEVK